MARRINGPSQARRSAPPPRLPLWSRPGYLVRRVHQIHSALFADECREYNITPVQYGVLTALLHFPGSDQVSLGAEVGIDRTNAADVLERLAERGLVKREKSERDRRMMLAYLTPEGEALTRDMHHAMQRAQERLLAPLPPGDRERFMAMLVTLVDAGNELGRPAARSAESPLRRRRSVPAATARGGRAGKPAAAGRKGQRAE